MSLAGLNRDYAEMLVELSAADVEYPVVGAHALAAHDNPRATRDFDIWVRPTPENARRTWNALARFGAPLHELTVEDLSVPGLIYQVGDPPQRIDIITVISGVTFDEAWPNRIMATDPLSGVTFPVIGRAELIRNKRAVARPQDLVDADNLERGDGIQ